MQAIRRLTFLLGLGIVVGVGVVLALEPETREKLWKEVVDKSENCKIKFKECQEKLVKAIEEGKKEAASKERQLELGIAKQEKEESPDYIV